jgi:hypothetical protein
MALGVNALFGNRRFRETSDRRRNAPSVAIRLFATLLSCFCLAGAFNIDTKAPIIKQGSPDSYFGFSLAQHYVQDHETGDVSPV